MDIAGKAAASVPTAAVAIIGTGMGTDRGGSGGVLLGISRESG